MKYIVDVLLLALLVAASAEDLHDHMVSDKFTIGFAVLAAISTSHGLMSAAVALVLTALVWVLPECRAVGGADIIVMGGFIARFGLSNAPYALIALSAVALLMFIFWWFKDHSNRGVPMMPAFLISYIILLFI